MRSTAAAALRPATSSRFTKKGPFQGQPDRPTTTTALPTDPVPSRMKTTASTTGHRNTVPVTRTQTSEARQRPSGGESSQAYYSESDALTLADLILDRTRSTSEGMIRWMALYLRLQEAEGEGKTPSKQDVAALQLAARGKVKTPPIPDSQKSKIAKIEDAVSRDKPAAQATASPAPASSRGVAREQPPSVSQHTEPAAEKAIPRVHKTTDRAVAPSAHAQKKPASTRPPQGLAADSRERDGRPQEKRAKIIRPSQGLAVEPEERDGNTAETEMPEVRRHYPPIIVESLPDWSEHLKRIAVILDHIPNVRAYGNGLRFFPADNLEYTEICEYLKSQDEARWFTYSPPTHQRLKVAIRGLPRGTDPQLLQEALREQGFSADYARQINGRKGRNGCIYHVCLKRAPGLTPAIYAVDMLLMMPIKIEAWRGERRLAQCFRCQQFRHSSQLCHNNIACVRCGGPHFARDCGRPKDAPATCANCGGAHTANNKKDCPVFKKEMRHRRTGTVARSTDFGRTRTAGPAHNTVTETAAASLMAPANDPPPRGGKIKSRRTRRKRIHAQPADLPAQPAHTSRPTTPEIIIDRDEMRTPWTRVRDQPLGYCPRPARSPRTESPNTVEEYDYEQEDEQEQEYL